MKHQHFIVYTWTIIPMNFLSSGILPKRRNTRSFKNTIVVMKDKRFVGMDFYAKQGVLGKEVQVTVAIEGKLPK